MDSIFVEELTLFTFHREPYLGPLFITGLYKGPIFVEGLLWVAFSFGNLTQILNS